MAVNNSIFSGGEVSSSLTYQSDDISEETATTLPVLVPPVQQRVGVSDCSAVSWSQ